MDDLRLIGLYVAGTAETDLRRPVGRKYKMMESSIDSYALALW